MPAVISAVVVNYNGRAYLRDCLEALLAQSPPPDEILLVDNHSDDGSREFVAEHFPEVRVVDTGSNLGPAAARNRGVELARGDLLALVDNDVAMQPGCLRELRAVLEADPRTALVQARSVCADQPRIVHYDHADLHFLGTLVLHNFFVPLERAVDPGGTVGAAVALCVLVRRAAYEQVRGFGERLFILYEDNELSWKLRMHGWSIRLAPRALCLHRGGTAGLSIRSATAAYTGRRTFLHCRNRWLVLWSCMRWRTLLLTLPAQLVYALTYLGFALSRGQMLAGLRGHAAAIAGLPWALRNRAVQKGRVVPDRDLLEALPMTLHPGVADKGFGASLRRGLDRGFSLYWRVVRRLCG